MNEYLVIYEQGEETWGAYSPDLPGCVAAGATREEVEELMRDAIPFHIAGLREAGLPVPAPTSSAGYVPA
jgi:predicted RNase H-like HicB family nuclease